jgi:hypothetical protein
MIKLINIQRAPGWRGLKYGYRLTAEETRASDDVCAELSVVRARRRAIEDATDAERGSEMRLNYGLAGTCCKRWRCNTIGPGKKRRKLHAHRVDFRDGYQPHEQGARGRNRPNDRPVRVQDRRGRRLGAGRARRACAPAQARRGRRARTRAPLKPRVYNFGYMAQVILGV